jgi:hypothetical protein
MELLGASETTSHSQARAVSAGVIEPALSLRELAEQFHVSIQDPLRPA